LAERAWDAFRSPNPRRIEDLLRSDTSALPFLAAALRRHLAEFPSTADGLSKTERRLLELAKDGPIDHAEKPTEDEREGSNAAPRAEAGEARRGH